MKKNVIINIQSGFGGYGVYWTNDWYRRYDHRYHYWRPSGYIQPTVWWRTPKWGVTWSWFHGYSPYYHYHNHPRYYDYYRGPNYVSVYTPPTPVYYNYGDNVVYQGDMVYVNGVPFVSAEKYYEQSLELASRGEKTTVIQVVQPNADGTGYTMVDPNQATPTTQAPLPTIAPTIGNKPAAATSTGFNTEAMPEDPSEQWLPLGTFAILKDEETGTSEQVLQLAMNRGGVLRGNIYDEKEDKLLPIIGAVDQETQRVAFRLADDQSRVYECGLWNLTQESLPLLVHEGKEKTETMKAVRLKDPNAQDDEADETTSTEYPVPVLDLNLEDKLQ